MTGTVLMSMSGENAIEATPTGAPAPPPEAGWWPSSWSAAEVAAGKVSRGGLQTDGGSVYWTESRPDEGGRQVVVGRAHRGRRPRDSSPPGVSVRSRVHEYGGGAATVAGGVLFYVDQADQAWYRLALDGGPPGSALGSGPPVRHAPGRDAVRYADGRLTAGGRWLLSVEERLEAGRTDHRMVALPVDGRAPAVPLCVEDDFVAAPRPSPDGRWLAWVGWDHPSMPWDSSSVWVAPLAEDAASIDLGARRRVAGGDGIAVGQPRWCRDGSLLFVDDRNGWWLPYRVAPSSWVGVGSGGLRPVCHWWICQPSSTGRTGRSARRPWPNGRTGRSLARMHSSGRDALVVLRPGPAGPLSGGWTLSVIEQPCVTLAGVASLPGGAVVVLGSTATEAQWCSRSTPAASGHPAGCPIPRGVTIPAEEVSVARPVPALPGGHGVPGQFFAPVNPVVDPAAGAPPPLVVFCHGGPTGAAEAGYDPVVQFFTSRGIAVAAVDYRGSTGYGRAYRDQLRGRWGEDDVDDCVAFAEALVPGGAGGRVPDGHPRDERGRTHRPRRPRPVPALRRCRVLVRGDRPRGPGRRHPRLRVAVPRRSGRPAARGGGPLPGPIADPPSRSCDRNGPAAARGRRSGRTRLPVRGVRRPPGGCGRRLPPRGVRRGVPRLPPGRDHRGRPRAELSFYRSLFTPRPRRADRERAAALRAGPRAG